MKKVDARLLVRALVEEHRNCERRDKDAAFGRYSEHHLHHVLARTLERKIGAWTVLEGYHGSYGKRERCDVFAELPSGRELWIEAKRGWHGTGKGWNSKPREQLLTWLKDLRRLRSIDGGAQRGFVLVHYAQKRVLRVQSVAPAIRAAGRCIGKALLRRDEYEDLLPVVDGQSALALIEATMRTVAGEVCIEARTGKTTIKPGEQLVYRYLACVF